MRGLILKDLLSLRRSLMLSVVYVTLIAFMMIRSDGTGLPAMMIMIFASTVGIGLFNMDENARADVYIHALPVSVRQIVTARYAVLLGIDAVGLLAGVALTCALDASVMEFLVGALALIAVMISVNAPLMYRFGGSKGRLALLVIVAGVVAAGFLLPGLLEDGEMPLWLVDGLARVERMNASSILAALAALTAAMLGVSWLISCRIVSKREP